jgi:cyclophilin family peptidyl-prolyl cis-trans isomerase
MRLTFALVLLLLIAPFVSVNIWAQGSPTLNADIQCQEIMEIADSLVVDSGGNLTCTITNPTNYVEDVAISIQGNGSAPLNYSAPDNVTVSPLGEVDFDVIFNGTTRTTRASTMWEISAVVTHANGVANPTPVVKTVTVQVKQGYYLENGCTTRAESNESHIRMDIAYVTADGSNSTENLIDFELNYDEAPIHAQNFALLAEMGCYDGTIFHRVIDGFMVQGGDFTNGDGTGGHAASWQGYCNGVVESSSSNCSKTSWTIPDEAYNGLIHTPYALSMAKTNAPHTGGSQFFIVDGGSSPSHLDGVHTVFGHVVNGTEVVDSISQVSVDGWGDVPNNAVTIISAYPFDLDSDGDGVIDDDDEFPNDENETTDSDGDGVGDNADTFPEDENETADSDGDGVGDNADDFPDDENETTDSDGDGVGNNSDAFPEDANETADSDGDGVGDNADIKPEDPEVSVEDDLQTEKQSVLSDSLLWGIVGAMVFLGLCFLVMAVSTRRKKTPDSPFDATDSIWNEN